MTGRENRVFLCTWRRRGSRYRVWVKRRPSLAAEAESFEEADEALWEAIAKATGDGENEHEYDPPEPGRAFTGSGLLRRLAMVDGNGRAHVANAEALFTRGYCPQCRRPHGKRTAAPLRAEKVAGGFEGGRAAVTMSATSPWLWLQYFSADFLRLLRPRERDSFEWRPIERRGRGKAFFELVSSRLNVPFAAFKPDYCWIPLARCDTCGGKSEPCYGFAPPTPFWYVSELDVPSPLPSCFTVGDRHERALLCFTPERWRQLVRRAGARGIRSYDVGVVDDRLVQRRPKYEPRSTLTWLT